MHALAQDVRYAARFLIKRPAVTLIAVLCLAIGIGADTAMFSPMDVFLWRPFPYPQPDRLVVPLSADLNRGGDGLPYSLPDFADLRAGSKLLDIAAFSYRTVNLSGHDLLEQVQGVAVSANFLRVLRTPPLWGRDFLPEEERPGAASPVILSYELWEQRFGADRHVVGETLKLDGLAYTIVGIMPPKFGFPFQFGRLWTPLMLRGDEPRASHSLDAVARLAPGATLEQARAELAGIALQLERQYPESNRGIGAMVRPVRQSVYGPEFRFGSGISGVAVAFLLLIAVANVANLLLTQAAGRDREIALRRALGAGRGRVIRQLLTESLILGLAAGALALGFAYGGIKAIVAVMPSWFPRLNEMRLDGRVLAFGALVMLVAAALAGLAPAIQLSGRSVRETLQEGGRASSLGRRGGRMRGAFVAAQIALSIALVVAAGLLAKGFVRLRSKPLGFETGHLLTLATSLPATKYPDPLARSRFRDQLVDRIRGLPGVTAVGAGSGLPTMDGAGTTYAIEGEEAPPGPPLRVGYRTVTPGYFAALGAALERGRDFTSADGSDAPLLAIVNAAFARRHWPGGDPLGKRVVLNSGSRQIVGVVRDIRESGPQAGPPTPIVYLPAAQLPPRTIALAVRTAGDPVSLVEPVRNAVLALDSDQPVFDVMTMDQRIALATQANGVVARIMIALSGIALLLAIVGVYGVVSYSVSQRSREIGIRMALGAARGDVLAMVLSQSGRLVLVGAAGGVLLALGLSRALSIFLFGVSPFDPVIFTVAPLVLALAATLASYLPARTATRVDPLTALRAE
jgi:putative ABC transport system permease protein